MATMLQLMQQCTTELGIPTPNTVAGNSNLDVVQLLALMNANGYELLRRADWQRLTKQHHHLDHNFATLFPSVEFRVPLGIFF